MASFINTIINIREEKFEVSQNESGRFDLRLIPKPAITQTLTYEVINYYVPAGHIRSIAMNLEFTPKLGDIITFGESRTCYTIIELPHANELNPWMILLDRPLEEPIQADRAGFVTATVHLGQRMPAEGWIPMGSSFLDQKIKRIDRSITYLEYIKNA